MDTPAGAIGLNLANTVETVVPELVTYYRCIVGGWVKIARDVDNLLAAHPRHVWDFPVLVVGSSCRFLTTTVPYLHNAYIVRIVVE